jgi:drug/metabolite transporter (DMT)-like permease
MALGIAMLGETLTVELVAGMALVLAGILVGTGAVSTNRNWARQTSSDPAR